MKTAVFLSLGMLGSIFVFASSNVQAARHQGYCVPGGLPKNIERYPFDPVGFEAAVSAAAELKAWENRPDVQSAFSRLEEAQLTLRATEQAKLDMARIMDASGNFRPLRDPKLNAVLQRKAELIRNESRAKEDNTAAMGNVIQLLEPGVELRYKVDLALAPLVGQLLHSMGSLPPGVNSIGRAAQFDELYWRGLVRCRESILDRSTDRVSAVSKGATFYQVVYGEKGWPDSAIQADMQERALARKIVERETPGILKVIATASREELFQLPQTIAGDGLRENSLHSAYISNKAIMQAEASRRVTLDREEQEAEALEVQRQEAARRERAQKKLMPIPEDIVRAKVVNYVEVWHYIQLNDSTVAAGGILGMFLGLNPYSISINVDNLKCNRSGGKYDCSYSTHVNFERGAEVWGSFFADLGRAIGGENARQEQYTFEWVNGQLFSKKMRANSESAYIKYQAGVTANAEAAARAEKRECERYNENQAWKPGGGSFRYCN